MRLATTAVQVLTSEYKRRPESGHGLPHGRYQLTRKDLTAAQRTPGRVAAQLMFGLWRNLLDTGSDIGDHANANPARCAPTTKLCGAPSCGTPSPAAGWRRASAARSSPAPEPSVWSSRCTPCATSPPTTKPLVNGFPLHGEQRRLSAAQGHRACLQLARLLDRDLATC